MITNYDIQMLLTYTNVEIINNDVFVEINNPYTHRNFKLYMDSKDSIDNGYLYYSVRN